MTDLYLYFVDTQKESVLEKKHEEFVAKVRSSSPDKIQQNHFVYIEDIEDIEEIQRSEPRTIITRNYLFETNIGASQYTIGDDAIEIVSVFPLRLYPELQRNGDNIANKEKQNNFSLGTLAEAETLEFLLNQNIIQKDYKVTHFSKKVSNLRTMQLKSLGIKINEETVESMLEKYKTHLEKKGYSF